MNQKNTLPGSGFLDIWQLAWPSIASNLLAALVAIAHLKIVADLGSAAVAGVTTGHRYFFLLLAVIIAISISASALVAQSWGGGKHQEAASMASAAIFYSAVLSVLIALPSIVYPEFIVAFFGLAPDASQQATSFVRWLAIFNIAYALNIISSSLLRATGDVLNPLKLGILSNIANVLGAAILAKGLFGAPKLGVSGLGIGAGIGVSITTLGFLTLWMKGHLKLPFIWRGALTAQRRVRLLRTGFPVALEQLVIQLSVMGFLAIVALYGTEAYAAYGIGVALLSVSFVIGLGFGIANATLVGQLLGAGKPVLAKKAGWRTMNLSVVCMASFAILLAIIARPLAESMTQDQEVINLTISFIYILAIAQPIMGVEFSLAGALRGAGDTRFPLISTFTGLLIGRIGLACVFVTLEFNIYWIFAVSIADFAIKASLLSWRFHSGRWKKYAFNHS